MRDFPPVVPDFITPYANSEPPSRRSRRAAPAASFVDPDTRGPHRYLFWFLRQQRGALLISSLIGVVEWLPGWLGPYLVGRIVDEGIIARDLAVVGWLSLILLGVSLAGVIAGVLRHTYIVRTWLVAMYGSMKLTIRQATHMGHVLPQRVPTGEILSISDSDSDQFGAVTEVLTRALGALIAYLMIAGLVFTMSWQLGLVVLVTAPLLVILAAPLLRPLERRQEVERNRVSDLTSLATDIVAGLRILRGIGGERTFSANYDAQSQRTRRAGVEAGRWQAAVEGASVLFSGLFLVVLTWLGARELSSGQISVGGLISLFGYAVFMVWPIQTFFELAQEWVRAVVSARKAIAVMEQQPPWRTPEVSLVLPPDAEIVDERSGFVGWPGDSTIVVSAVPEDSAALADRLGRYLPGDHDPVSIEGKTDATGRAARKAARARARQERENLLRRDAELADRRWGVRIGSVDLADVPIADVRDRVLVADTASAVFAGTLQDAVDPHGRLSREQAEEAMWTAAAEDVFEALPGGWQGELDERGRGLSGGQRQRLVLARALAADPDILILVEPTSAVDAHTEALIAARLADARRGRTTIMTTSSPLLLHYADRVAFLHEGRVVDAGTHEELVRRNGAYRAVVDRNLDAEPSSTTSDHSHD
jgi:ABC-type multidrug transport system fused ATPase/permease subunit